MFTSISLKNDIIKNKMFIDAVIRNLEIIGE